MRLAILLGPYRNLTTLTAAILSLHPSCQALNHAAERLLGDPELDFFSRLDARTYARFIAAAFEASGDGKRGKFGGSILHSHVYEDPRMQALYAARYGSQTLKPEPTCLVWKDSMRIQRRLMGDPPLLGRLCATFPDLRFLMPIRNPLDCAVSNLSTGQIQHLGESKDSTLERSIDVVLDAYAWVLDKRDAFPDRIFVFTQFDERPKLFESLADFLGLTRSEDWMSDATAAFTMRRDYQHGSEAMDYMREAARARLERWPQILERIGY